MSRIQLEIAGFDCTISVPLDSAGFLRRACPTCARELKWRLGPEAAEEPPALDGDYVCPYCGIRSPASSWWTEAQLQATRAQAINEIVDPEIGRLAASSGPPPGHIPTDLGATLPDDPPALREPDDMREVRFGCHQMPVKVADDWSKPVHCPLCGELGGEWAEGR